MAEQRPASVQDALAEYYDDLALADIAPSTIRTYRYQLAKIDPDLPLVDFDRAYCRTLMMESVRTRKAQTSRTYHGILSGFTRWLVERGYSSVNAMDGVGQPKQPEIPVSALSEAQIEALEGACHDDTDRLIIAMLLGTGLRRAELAAARWEDLDCSARTLSVIGKGRRRRTVLIPREVMAMLHPATGSILNMEGNAIWKRVKKVGKRAGMPFLRPHMLRHSYATRWLLKGGSTFNLMTLGGWRTDKLIRERYAKSAVERAALDEALKLE